MSSTTKHPIWNEGIVSTLRILWTEGHATAEIARRMALSKNAIVGKAHRLGLPARPSPIRKRPAIQEPPQESPEPPVPIVAAAAPAPVEQPTAPVAQAPKVVPPPPHKQPVLPLKPLTSRIVRVDDCQWPIGTPGAAGFRLCGTASAPGKPYCKDHCSKAYVRVRPINTVGASV